MPCGGRLGGPELLMIAFLIILLFGASRLPQIGSGLGQGIRKFKKGLRESDESEEDEAQTREDKGNS